MQWYHNDMNSKFSYRQQTRRTLTSSKLMTITSWLSSMRRWIFLQLDKLLLSFNSTFTIRFLPYNRLYFYNWIFTLQLTILFQFDFTKHLYYFRQLFLQLYKKRSGWRQGSSSAARARPDGIADSEPVGRAHHGVRLPRRGGHADVPCKYFLNSYFN